MNNSERFYLETDLCIKMMYGFLSENSQNHEYQAKKMIKNILDCEMEVESFRFSFVSLVNLTSLALNKEKIENQAHIDWDDYKAEITLTLNNFEQKYSKIPYFKEWIQVCDCATKYTAENAQFWIKKIRNAFLHGQFELDYNSSPKSVIKILQGSPTKIDAKINIYEPGLTEFIEDNFRNIYNQGFGIKDEYVYLQYPDINITNYEALEEFISKTTRHRYKIDFNNYTYDGITLNSKNGKKLKPSIVDSQKLATPNQEISLPEYLVKDGDVTVLRQDKAKLLARLIDKKAGYIYTSGKKRMIVHKYFSNYSFPNQTINSILHELVNAINYVYFVIYLKCGKKHNYNNTFSILDFCKDTLMPTLTILQLYRLQYRLQSKNFKPIDYSNLQCEKLFGSTTPDLIKKRIDKTITNYPSLTAEQAINKTYLEILRNALAHGNVEYEIMFSEDLNTIYGNFTFTDSWTDKLGNHSETKIESNIECLQNLFMTIDKDLDFMPYKDLEV